MSPKSKEFSANLPQNLIKLVKLLNSPEISSVLSLLYEVTDDLNAALMLDNLVYWWGRSSKPDGWVWKSASDWWHERRLTQGQVSRVHRNQYLEQAGVERTQKLTLKGNPVHYRLHVETFIKRVAQVIGWTVEAVATVLYPEKIFVEDGPKPSATIDNSAIADSTNHSGQEEEVAFAESAKETSPTIQSSHNNHIQNIQTTTETDVVVKTDSVFSLTESEEAAAVLAAAKPTLAQYLEQHRANQHAPENSRQSEAVQERAEAAAILRSERSRFLQTLEEQREQRENPVAATDAKNTGVPPQSGEIVIDFEVVPGLKPHIAQKLVQQYGRERVVEIMRYVFGQNAKNPAGMVVKALREEWQVTFSSHVDKRHSPFAGMTWADFAG